MNRSGAKDLQKALDDTRMALYAERNEESALEKKVIEQAAVIAYQKLELDESRGKCADCDRMKQELENAKNELAGSKTVPTGPPKRLRESIYVTCSSECSRTVVERGLLLPVAISCPITLSYDCRYKINAGDKFFGEFLVGPATSSSSRVNALITFDIGANGALTGSVEYDGTKTEFKNVVSI